MVGVFIANVLLMLVAPSAGHSDDSYGKRDCTPGYDPDCPTPMMLTGSSLSPSASLPPSASPRAATQPQHQTGSSSKKTSSANAAETEKCLDVPDECVFPFSYKDQQYTTCTEVDAVGTKWCSAHKDYHGSWKECKKTCKDKWPVKTIVGTAVAGGVAAAGLGITLAATELMKHKKEGSQVPVTEARSQAISVPNGALNNPASSFGAIAASGTPGVQVESTPASVPVAAARFLDKQPPNVVPVTVDAPVTAKVVLQTVTTAPTQVNGWLVGFAIAAVAVCCCVCISGIVAACRSGLGKKRKHGNFIEVQDEASPGYPEAYKE